MQAKKLYETVDERAQLEELKEKYGLKDEYNSSDKASPAPKPSTKKKAVAATPR